MSIVAVSGEPELAPVVARWLVGEFFDYPGGMTVPAMTHMILTPRQPFAECFVLLEDGEPAGTASLATEDLEARPDLTPWLAGVFVRPQSRGRGYARALVRAVEGHARGHGISTLWLYTGGAAPLYAGLGWRAMGQERDRWGPVTLMRRDLGPQ